MNVRFTTNPSASVDLANADALRAAGFWEGIRAERRRMIDVIQEALRANPDASIERILREALAALA